MGEDVRVEDGRAVLLGVPVAVAVAEGRGKEAVTKGVADARGLVVAVTVARKVRVAVGGIEGVAVNVSCGGVAVQSGVEVGEFVRVGVRTPGTVQVGVATAVAVGVNVGLTADVRVAVLTKVGVSVAAMGVEDGVLEGVAARVCVAVLTGVEVAVKKLGACVAVTAPPVGVGVSEGAPGLITTVLVRVKEPVGVCVGLGV
ncbi:MAG: hypothetical protein N3C12_13525 [Candidatus Binatia bacterium]|nr:hypothetical protein [Candidatus Binatia bacterium]